MHNSQWFWNNSNTNRSPLAKTASVGAITPTTTNYVNNTFTDGAICVGMRNVNLNAHAFSTFLFDPRLLGGHDMMNPSAATLPIISTSVPNSLKLLPYNGANKIYETSSTVIDVDFTNYNQMPDKILSTTARTLPYMDTYTFPSTNIFQPNMFPNLHRPLFCGYDHTSVPDAGHELLNGNNLLKSTQPSSVHECDCPDDGLPTFLSSVHSPVKRSPIDIVIPAPQSPPPLPFKQRIDKIDKLSQTLLTRSTKFLKKSNDLSGQNNRRCVAPPKKKWIRRHYLLGNVCI